MSADPKPPLGTAAESQALVEWRRWRDQHPDITPNPAWPGGRGRVADCARVLRAGGDPVGLYTDDEIRLARLRVNGEEGGG